MIDDRKEKREAQIEGIKRQSRRVGEGKKKKREVEHKRLFKREEKREGENEMRGGRKRKKGGREEE